MTVCFCVSLFNHLCCFTLRTDGFGNLPSGGRTKTRKTFQAGRFKNEKRKRANSDTWNHHAMYVSTTNRRTDSRLCNFGTAQLESPRSLRLRRLRCDECSPASILKKKRHRSTLLLWTALFPDHLEKLQVWAASIHTFPFKELLLLRRFKYPASQPLANCNVVLHRLANFDFACKAAMGSGRNEMSIDRGKCYLHSLDNTSLKTCHHPWMNHSDIVQKQSLNMASWHTSAWELLLGVLAKRQVERTPMISP